jgi:hypothetical protein
VSRTAFHQLKYSLSLLLIVTTIFLTIYALPSLGLFSDSTLGQTSADHDSNSHATLDQPGHL